jgi:hypothetical protein
MPEEMASIHGSYICHGDTFVINVPQSLPHNFCCTDTGVSLHILTVHRSPPYFTNKTHAASVHAIKTHYKQRIHTHDVMPGKKGPVLRTHLNVSRGEKKNPPLSRNKPRTFQPIISSPLPSMQCEIY